MHIKHILGALGVASLLAATAPVGAQAQDMKMHHGMMRHHRMMMREHRMMHRDHMMMRRHAIMRHRMMHHRAM